MPTISSAIRALAAATLCAALALGSLGATTRPAQALDADTFGRLLLGAATVGVVAKIYHDRRENARAPTPPPVQQATSPQYTGPGYRHGPRFADTGPSRVPRPIRCARQLQTETGWVRFYSQACLDRVGAEISVPQSCLRQRWVDGRWLQYFNRRCLARFGRVEGA